MGARKDVVIMGAARTPIGKFTGCFSGITATKLGSLVVREAIQRSQTDPRQVDYTIMGNVLGAGLGQAPARQAAVYAGIPETSSALTVNKMCASGLMAVILGTQMIKAGDVAVAVAGGMENMTRAPHILGGSREGKRLGDWELSDTMLNDGLWCRFNNRHMGHLAEKTATDFEITREEQDRFAFTSHQRALAAGLNQKFANEIVPVSVSYKGVATVIDRDEGPRVSTSFEELSSLKSVFPPGETVTAGNSSQISDGAAALVIGEKNRVKELGARPIARIDDYVWVANDTSRLFEAPHLAVRRLLQKGRMKLRDIDLLEINEAFAAQVVANGKSLQWDWERVNVNGGGIALGHPIGASGARILVTLLYALADRRLATGIAALCHAGGGAAAVRVTML